MQRQWRRFRGLLLCVAASGALSALSPWGAVWGGAWAAAPGASSPPTLAESFAGNYLAAHIAGRVKDTRAEAAFLRESLRRLPGDDDLRRRAFTASILNGDIEQAAALALPADGDDGAAVLARFIESVRALKAGRFADARRDLARLGAGPFESAVVALTAWAHLGEGNADQALELLDRVHDEGLVRFRDYHAGLIADVRGYTYEARKRFRALYDSDGRTLRTVDAYARFLARTGAVDEARAIYREFDKQAPRNAWIQSALRDLESGQTLAPLAADARAGAAEALYAIGAASSRQSDPMNGLIFHRLAVYLDPAHALAWAAIGEIYGRLRQPERALEAYAAIPAHSPLRPLAEAQSGLLLHSMERREDAAATLRAAVAARPDDLRLVETLADVLRMQQNWSESARWYGKAIELLGEPGPNDWRLFFLRAIAYERSGQWPRAEADLKLALTFAPENAQVLNYLAYTWADRNERLEDARVMLEKAATLAKNDGHIVDSLGWVYYRLGRYDDAVRELERAVAMVPAEAVVNEHLGDVYWKVGRQREAVFKWRQALDLKPEPTEVERIKSKLKDAESVFNGKLP